MEVSEKYLSMCIHAAEIQEKWEPYLGDFYWDGKYNELDAITIYPYEKPCDEDYGYWWIPRLDQLIELSGLDWWTFLKGLTSVVDYDEGEDELCVAIRYVMQLLYKKIWIGDRWG